MVRCVDSRLSRDYRRRNGDNVDADVLISIHIRDVNYTLSRWQGFRLFCVSLAVHYLAVYSIFELSLVVSATSTKADRNFDNRFSCLPRFMERFFVCLSISLPFIQLLLFVHETSVSYLNSC